MKWQKSSRCESSGCVEVLQAGNGWVFVRASQNPRHMMRFSEDEWRDFIAGAKTGDFDI